MSAPVTIRYYDALRTGYQQQITEVNFKRVLQAKKTWWIANRVHGRPADIGRQFVPRITDPYASPNKAFRGEAMADEAVYNLGTRLINRITSACQLYGIDTRKARERMLAEEISRGISKHLIPRHMIKGGLLHPQVTRETSGLDILFERKITPAEISRAFELMKRDLAAKGIELRNYTAEPEPIHIEGHDGDRYKVCAFAGNIRIHNKIEVVGGTQLFPKLQPERRHGSVFFKGQEPLLGLYQTFESQAADKLIEVITNPDTTRWKDFRDLSMLHGMKLDPSIVGAEVVHKVRRKFDSDHEILKAFPEEPVSLKWEFAKEKAQLWNTWKDNTEPHMNVSGVLTPPSGSARDC